ncbi:solute carrier family 66 member 2-like [Clytia hemisphaerica]|uniref:Solute carrier family 66 member 2 n=1 Tax=Clytia hemisphaerica TaxID=252671 RepID=A0A7M5UZH6_9CNID
MASNKVAEFAHAVKERFSHEDWSAINLMTLVSWTASGAMIFGGVVPYIPQYYDIYISKDTEGFSTYVCLALLVANILRILFWFGHPFELPLLAQSVIMIFAMLVMLELCTRIKRENELTAKRRKFTDFDMNHFWNWTHFNDYLKSIILFSLFGCIITFCFANYPVYLETLGFVSVFTEAMLGAPQFYRNFKNKSTTGMSVKMVGMWFCGDTFKTGYFVIKNAPVQFGICGLLQVTIDMSILYQVFHYGRKRTTKD